MKFFVQNHLRQFFLDRVFGQINFVGDVRDLDPRIRFDDPAQIFLQHRVVKRLKVRLHHRVLLQFLAEFAERLNLRSRKKIFFFFQKFKKSKKKFGDGAKNGSGSGGPKERGITPPPAWISTNDVIGLKLSTPN